MAKGSRFFIVLLAIIIVIGYSSTRFYAQTNTNQAQLYENKKLGFSLQFPGSWNGYFIILEEEDTISVNFVGKSKRSQMISGTKVYGLELFSIGTEKYVKENEFLIDSIKEIGSSNNMKLYYFTSTGVTIEALIDPRADFEEKELAANDFIKAKAMREDIPAILNTFKGISVTE